MIIPNRRENKIDVPNHQPEYILHMFFQSTHGLRLKQSAPTTAPRAAHRVVCLTPTVPGDARQACENCPSWWLYNSNFTIGKW